MDKTNNIKVATIVIDGACVDILKPWIRDKKLPNLEKIYNKGCSADLCSEFPPVTFLNNPSMFTGMNVGNHGIINWLKRTGNNLEVVDSKSIKDKFLWDILGEHNKKSIIMNMPLTYPPQKINGIMISRSVIPPLKNNYIYPESLEDEIADKVGDYKVFQEEIYGAGKDKKFYNSICEALDVRTKTASYLLKNYDWDFFMLGISAVDAVQHAYWKYLDQNHPKYNKEKAEKYGDYIFKIYEKVDSVIGELLNDIGENSIVMLISDHGAGPLYARTHSNNLLMKLDLLKLKKTLLVKIKYLLFKCGVTMQNCYKIAVLTGLVNIRKTVDPRSKGKGVIRNLFLSWNDIDWKKTKAVVLGTGGQIYLNQNSDDFSYENVVDLITKELLAIKIPGTNALYVEKVCRKEELYWGNNLKNLPDLLFFPADQKYEESGDYEFYSNKLFDEVWGISCNHRRNAMFVVQGKGIKKGVHLNKTLKMYDITPIVLSLFNIVYKGKIDGQVVEEIYDAVK